VSTRSERVGCAVGPSAGRPAPWTAVGRTTARRIGQGNAAVGGTSSLPTRCCGRGRPPAEAARAVEVLTDLSMRGYPAVRVGDLVKDVLARDSHAISRLPAALESIRLDSALTYSETVDALARGLAGADTLQAAYARTLNNQRRPGAHGRLGWGRESPARNLVPPGVLRRPLGEPGRGRPPRL